MSEPERIFMPSGWEVMDGSMPVDRMAERDDICYIRADIHAAAIARLENDVQAYSEANHAQALCINFAASALGADYAATIQGLPKGCRSMRERAERAETALAIAEEALRGAIDAIDAAYDGPDDNGAYTVRERAALAKIEALKGGA